MALPIRCRCGAVDWEELFTPEAFEAAKAAGCAPAPDEALRVAVG